MISNDGSSVWQLYSFDFAIKIEIISYFINNNQEIIE